MKSYHFLCLATLFSHFVYAQPCATASISNDFVTGYDASVSLVSPSTVTGWAIQLTITGNATGAGTYASLNNNPVPSTSIAQSGNILTITPPSTWVIPAGSVNILIFRATKNPSDPATVTVVDFPVIGGGNCGSTGGTTLTASTIWETDGVSKANLNTGVTNLQINALTKIYSSQSLGSDALQLYFHEPQANGRYQYLYFSNRNFVSGGNMYSAIGGYEADPNSSIGNLQEGPRPLILQPQILGGNVGIGYHQSDPIAKLSVSGWTDQGGSSTHGITSKIATNKNEEQYGVGSELQKTGLNGTGRKIALFGKSGYNDANYWAGFFEGKTEVKGSMILGSTDSKYIFHSGTGQYPSLFITPSMDVTENWNWGVQLEFRKTGELIKRMSDPSKRAFAVETSQNNDVFRVMGDGKVYATEVNVKLPQNFPDYVFDSTYVLMPLADLARYISENKHLPNMPTAEKVKEQGADLGEINRLLVEKVEELTLHILELNNRLELLENK